MMVKNTETIKRLGKERGRKIYNYGDRITLDVPKYVDIITLDWINSQPSIATKVWDILIKTAHSDSGQAKSMDILKALGLENIEKLTEILNASDNTTIYSGDLKNSEESPKVSKIIETLNTTGDLNALNEKKNDIVKVESKNSVSESKEKNSSEEGLIISEKKQITEKSEELNQDIYRKDGHMNLKEIVKKNGSGRRGLSRNTERSQLNSENPNLMEIEMGKK